MWAGPWDGSQRDEIENSTGMERRRRLPQLRSAPFAVYSPSQMSASSLAKTVDFGSPVRILGIDPGSRLCGYGVVDCHPRLKKIVHITHGTLRLSNTGGKALIPLEQRLLSIHKGLAGIIQEYKPQIMSVERVFFAKNAVSALKLGQARGAVILSGAIHGLDVVEYSPSEVKAALVGHGQADKFQVARMVELILGKQTFATSDASDGLALALCHAQIVQLQGATLRNHGLALTGRDSLKRSALGARKGRSIAESLGIAAENAPKRQHSGKLREK